MTDLQKQEMKDLIVQAIQAGKKENSGLVGEIKRGLEGWIKDTIKIVVNGKIDTLTKMQQEQTNMLIRINDVQIAMQKEQQNMKAEIALIQTKTNTLDGETKPLVTEYNNKKTVVNYFSDKFSFIKNTAAVAGAITALWVFIKWINHVFQ